MAKNREYATMVQTAELKPGLADFTSDEVGQNIAVGLSQVLQKASKGLQTLQGGGWEILSHDLTRIDRHLVVSLLICRDR